MILSYNKCKPKKGAKNEKDQKENLSETLKEEA